MEGWWAASYAVLWMLVIVLCIVVVALARQIGTLHLRLGPRGALEMDDEGPPLGDAPPTLDAIGPSDARVTVGGPGAERMILFVSPGCLVCEQVLPGIAPVARSAGLEASVVSDVDRHETERAFASKRLDVAVLAGPEVVAAYEVPGTPYLVVMNERGVVTAKGTVNNLEQMEGLVQTARTRGADAAERRAG